MQVKDILNIPDIKIESSKWDVECLLELVESDYTYDDFNHVAYVENEDGDLVELWGISGTAKTPLGGPDFFMDDAVQEIYKQTRRKLCQKN